MVNVIIYTIHGSYGYDLSISFLHVPKSTDAAPHKIPHGPRSISGAPGSTYIQPTDVEPATAWARIEEVKQRLRSVLAKRFDFWEGTGKRGVFMGLLWFSIYGGVPYKWWYPKTSMVNGKSSVNG